MYHTIDPIATISRLNISVITDIRVNVIVLFHAFQLYVYSYAYMVSQAMQVSCLWQIKPSPLKHEKVRTQKFPKLRNSLTFA